ncbi:DUF6778 family protein [Actibacterium pelagium]|uniref:Lipoprotein n=1 Tax=Actibacterium pelagium TaxID=2029103 RepID=A0A917EIT1_9RHOB|nr:DUF6778 family protein [Actibacterium pelagium]GGE41581.1 hypothetical protein GCM10011517_06480 [Actibacterium pelagium]
MSKVSIIAAITSMAMLAGCTTGQWQTSYNDVVSSSDSRNWRVTEIDVRVPETLTVSEENSFAPDADIVWREEPRGDRYAQVDRIITEAAQRGSSGLRGNKPVKLVLVVDTFHALSEKARTRLSRSGVHNIGFTAQVFDARTGQALTPADQVQADLVAYVGEQANAAVAQGQTQRVRIVRHVANTIAGWLAAGPDPRGVFSRRGR